MAKKKQKNPPCESFGTQGGKVYGIYKPLCERILCWVFAKHNFQYRLPSLAQMKLSCELFDYQVTLPVAQFGPVVDLPHRHFKALFDPTTGAIVYFEN